MNRKIIVLIIVLILIFVIGCSEQSTIIQEPSTELSQESQEPEQTSTQEPNETELEKEIEENITFKLVNENKLNITKLSYNDGDLFIVDELVEYGEKIINFDNKEYKIKVENLIELKFPFIKQHSISLIVDSELFENLVDGEIIQLNDGTYIGIIEIVVNEASEGPRFIVEIYLGLNESKFNPRNIDKRICQDDDECTIVPSYCCKCGKHNVDVAVNKKYEEDYISKLNTFCESHGPLCVKEEEGEDWTCTAESKCINNKCTLVSTTSKDIRTIEIITDKEEYAFNSSIKINITNNRLNPIYFGGCKKEFNPFITILEKTEGGGWEKYFVNDKISVVECQNETPYKLNSGEQKEFDFNIYISTNNLSYIATSGAYQLYFKYALDEGAEQSYPVKSNAFVVE